MSTDSRYYREGRFHALRGEEKQNKYPAWTTRYIQYELGYGSGEVTRRELVEGKRNAGISDI